MKKKLFMILVLILGITILGCSLQKKKDIENDKEEKILSCKIKATNESEGISISESRTFYFDDKNSEKLTKYIQTVSFDYKSIEAINYGEKNYNSAIKTCNDLKDLSGVHCSIKNNDDNNLVVELEVVLKELEEGTELADNLENLKDLSYNQIYDGFKNSDSPWKCE